MNKLSTYFSDLKVKTKLAVLILIFLLSQVFISIVAGTFFRSLESLNIVVNEQLVFLRNFQKGVENFYEFEISGDSMELRQSNAHFEKAYRIAFTFSHIDSLMNTMPKEEWVADFYEVFKDGVVNPEQVELMAEQIHFLSRVDPASLADVKATATDAYQLTHNIIFLIDSYRTNPSAEKLQTIQKEFAKIDRVNEVFTAGVYELNDHITNMLITVMIILVILLIAFATFISILISKSIASPIARLADNFKKIAKGNLKSSVRIESNNEIGDLSRAFLEIQTGLQNIIDHSKKVANGDYSNNIVPKSENDELTVSLNKMTNRLQQTKEKAEKEVWLQNGISRLDDVMRGNYPVRELSDKIINYICDFLNVEMGALYIYDEAEEYLELTGYAGINPEEAKKKLKPGEGLIGKAAKNNRLQVVDTADKYHKIFSASGEIVPEKLYLLPLFYNNRIQAVTELASTHELTEIKIEFLQLIKERISVNLNAAVARYRSDELLKKTLDQAKILETRDKELQQKLEEDHKIQKELVKEKALLDSMLKIIPDNIHFKDLDNKFLRVSESLLNLVKAKNADEIIGKTDFDFYEKQEAQKYFEEEKSIIENREGYIDKINKNTDDDENVTWTSVTKLPLFDKNGECIGTFSISKDVTPIKKLEIEVQKQNDELLKNQHELKNTIERMNKVQSDLEYEKSLMDSLLNTLPDAVYFKDLESRFIKVSQSMPKLFGKEKPEDLYGKTDFDFHDREHAEQAYQDEQKIIKTQEPIVGLVEKETRQDGTVRYVSSTKMPLINRKGKVMGIFGISRDITEIKKLELEVNERNEKLKAQQEELKVTNEELKTQEEELRVANEELAEQTKVLSENEKNLQTQQEELRVTNEELETKTILLEQQKKQMLVKNENLLKIQNELKQKARELEQANRYKSEFLANMSHELRTPLNSLLILSKLLGSNKKGNLTDEQVQSVNIIYKSGKDLLELINEILDLSKIEAGKMKYDFKEVPAGEFISEIKQTFEPVAESKRLHLELKQAEGFPEKIYTDKQRLMQIMKNLLSNAFKFTSNGGVKVNFGLPGKNTLFINDKLNMNNSYYMSVEDSGVGIPRDKLEGIFEAFQQADGSISRKFGGTGLGLSISRQLTYALGGEIHVSSNEGEGSVFTVYLPLDRTLINNGSGNNSNNKKKKQNAALLFPQENHATEPAVEPVQKYEK
ncbi:MAG: PAS domain-containing protein, partial [Prolixibacteraceae bacterium]